MQEIVKTLEAVQNNRADGRGPNDLSLSYEGSATSAITYDIFSHNERWLSPIDPETRKNGKTIP